MEMRVGKRSASLRDDDKFIPIFNDEPGGYTLWVSDDPQAPEECREYAQKVATILNAAPDLAAETLRQAQDENARLREALWDAYGFLVNLYCHDSNYPEAKRFLDKIEAVMPEVKPE